MAHFSVGTVPLSSLSLRRKNASTQCCRFAVAPAAAASSLMRSAKFYFPENVQIFAFDPLVAAYVRVCAWLLSSDSSWLRISMCVVLVHFLVSFANNVDGAPSINWYLKYSLKLGECMRIGRKQTVLCKSWSRHQMRTSSTSRLQTASFPILAVTVAARNAKQRLQRKATLLRPSFRHHNHFCASR